MWKLLLALAALGALARGNFVDELVGRVLTNPSQAHNLLFDTDHIAALAKQLEVERDFDDGDNANPPASSSKSSTSTTTSASKTSKSSTSSSTTTTAPAPACNNSRVSMCFSKWAKVVGVSATEQQTMKGVVTALKRFSSAKFGNLATVCSASTNFTTCVGSPSQYGSCMSEKNLNNFFQNQSDAWAAHFLAYMLPAECSRAAQTQFAVLSLNYQCFSKVSYKMEDTCASKPENKTLNFCQNLVQKEFHCIPNLYQKQCNNATAKAVCQLLKIQLAAIPDLLDKNGKNASSCNAHCEIYNYNGAPVSAGLSILGLLAAAVLAILRP